VSLEKVTALFVSASASALVGLSPVEAAIAADAAANDAATSATSGGDSGRDLAEVVITARRREERLQDVPITVTAVGGAALAEQHFDRVADYASKIANFNAIQQNTRVSTLTIRGVGGNANSDGSEAGVGVIVDNVFYTHPGFTWLDFVDLDHIELARGPQGTLLGKNTTLGALIVTTQKPVFTPEASASVTGGEHSRLEARANVSGPLIGDQLAGRLTLYRETQDGWVRNAYPGKDRLLDANRWALRGQLLFKAGANFTDRVIAEHFASRELNNFYAPVGDPTTYVNGAVRKGWSFNLQRGFGYAPSLDAPNNANLNGQGRAQTRTDGLSNEANWSLGKLDLTSITAWRRLYFRPDNDSDYSPYPVFNAGYAVDVNQYSQEFRVASPTGGRLDYQAGLYFLRQVVHSNYRTQLQSAATRFFLSPLLPASILDGVEVDQLGIAVTYSEAVFAQGTYHFNDKAAVTVGARITNEQKKASNQGLIFGGTALPAALAPYRAALTNALAPGAPFVVSQKKSGATPSLLLNPSYKINDNVLAYLSLSHGEKSGAANLGAGPATATTAATPVIIAPEKSNDLEIGLKNRLFDGRGILNINYYIDDITGYQATLVNTSGLSAKSYLANVGEVKLEGVEADAGLKINDILDLSASGAYGRAQFVAYRNAPPPPEYTYPGGPTSIDLSGTTVPGASKFTAQVSLDGHYPISDTLIATGYLNQTYRSATFTNALSIYGRQGGYGLTNLGLGVKTADGRYTLQLWAKNLFDKRYATAFGVATSATPYIKIFGEPRTIGLTLTAKAF
jgi:iron complex outermembrane receptor protein